jgi:PAS domain S-box-containing protein
LTGQSVQTLEDLRHASTPAWLWDGARGRIVWSNAAGIAQFDGQSVFDLIDRKFDAKEPGIERIAELSNLLQFGERQNALLHFPSTGMTVPLDCQCSLHALADGRPGVLVVVRQPEIVAPSGLYEAVFAQMPMAAALVSNTGEITRANKAARELFSVSNFSALLKNSDQAEALLQRLQHANLVSSIEQISGIIGQRDVRLTLQRLNEADGVFAVLLLEDITERRAAERQLNTAPPPKESLGTADAQTFEALARTLKAATQTETPPASKARPQIAPVVEALQPPTVPKTIRDALEQTGSAIAIMQNGTAAFATNKAAQLLDYNSTSALFANSSFWKALGAIDGSCVTTLLDSAQGEAKTLRVEVSTIPWMNGAAKQYVLKAVAVKAAVTVPEITAPPIAAPQLAPVVVAAVVSSAEDDLKNILDVASDGIITLDRQGQILSFSAGAEAIFGYRIAEVLERPLEDFLTLDSRKIMRDYIAGLDGPGLAAVFNDGREITAIVKQGGNVPLFLTLGRMQSSKSKATFCAVVRDITTWKRTEKELREAKETAEEASRQKSDFLARISHELRTPLNAIIGFSEVMRLGQFGEIKNEKYRGYVNDIHASGGQLLSLINDLLDLSKIEAGKMELNFTAVNIADTTEEASRLLQDAATRGRVLVRKSFPDKLPRVVADLRAMRQVMQNILSNAIKYTNPGGQVIVSAHISKSGELALRIKDTGIGMNTSQLKDSLEPFKRVETMGRETQGTGLGLPLTKALVEANRAKFDISSEPGQGTLIEITFPTTRVLAE